MMNYTAPSRTSAALLLGLLAALSFLSVRSFDFVNFDDHRILLSHPELYSCESFLRCLREIVVAQFPREEPLLLRDVSWLLDASIFGFANPVGYHVMNVFYHGLAVALFFIFLDTNTKHRFFSMTCTVIFLSLAVHVEPVSWVMGRKCILSTLCMLAGLISQTKSFESPDRVRREFWYLGSIFFTIAALMSKINAVFYPVVLLAHSVFYPFLDQRGNNQRDIDWSHALRAHLPGLLPHFFFSVAVFFWYRGILTDFGLFDRNYEAGFWGHLRNLFLINPLVFLAYVKDLLLPSNLSLLYTWPSTELPFSFLHILIALLFLASVLGIGFWMFSKRRDLFFYYFSFWVMMLPYCNLIYIGIWRANRYLYFSSAFLVTVLVGLIFPYFKSASRFRVLVGVLALSAIFLVNSIQKYRYLPVWENSFTLWSYEKQLAHGSLTPYHNLAEAYLSRAIVEEEPELRENHLKMADQIVQEGIDKNWKERASYPPSKLYKLFFFKAMIASLRHRPASEQINILGLVTRLNPEFAQAHKRLAALNYELALSAENPDRAKDLAQLSWRHLQDYKSTADRSLSTQEEIRHIETQFFNSFPYLRKNQ